MAQFFSAFQPDYGADITARGYNNAANQISGAMMQAAGARYEDASRTKRMQMEATIKEQLDQSALARQTAADIAAVGGQPIMDEASGKLNVPATLALTEKLKRARSVIESDEDLRRNLQIKQDADYSNRAAAVGVKQPQNLAEPSAVQAAWNSGQPIGDVPRTLKPSVGFPQLIQMAEDEKKLEMDKKLATANPSGSRFQNLGAYHVGGKYVGNPVLDGQTGQRGFMQNEQIVPMPEGAEPITSTGLQKATPSFDAFRKLKNDVTSNAISLKAMDRYSDSVGGSSQGFQLLADKFTTGMKTLLDSGQLTPQELAQASSSGQLQGLLGKFRSSILSPGVLTEPDAERIILALGGDVNAFRNPEVVAKQIGNIYSDKYKQYEDDVLFYNASVEDYYGSRNYPKHEKVPFSTNFTNDYQAEQAQPAVPGQPVSPVDPIPVQSPFSEMSDDQLQQRKAKLLQQRGQ
jgi:hypothetical protein